VLSLLYETNAQAVVNWFTANIDRMSPGAYSWLIGLLSYPRLNFARETSEILIMLLDDVDVCEDTYTDSKDERYEFPRWDFRVCDWTLNSIVYSLRDTIGVTGLAGTYGTAKWTPIPQRDTNIWEFKVWWSQNKDTVLQKLPSVTKPYSVTNVNARGCTNVASRGPLMSAETVNALKAKLRSRIQAPR